MCFGILWKQSGAFSALYKIPCDFHKGIVVATRKFHSFGMKIYFVGLKSTSDAIWAIYYCAAIKNACNNVTAFDLFI